MIGAYLSQIVGLAMFSASAFAIPFEAASGLTPRAGGWKSPFTTSGFDIQCSSLSADDQLTLEAELITATNLAQFGSKIFAASPYYQALFSAENKKSVSFELEVQTKYGKLAELYLDLNNKVQITCVTDNCGPTSYAWTSAAQKRINLCPRWFDNSLKVPSSTVIRQCPKSSPDTNKWDNLAKFKGTKAFTLFHEMTHLAYATNGDMTTRARDYAYGLDGCKSLAAGTAQAPLCGPPPAKCDQKLSFQNADSLAFVAAGAYWSTLCAKTITVDNLSGVADPPQTGDAPDDVVVVTVIPLPAKTALPRA